MGAELACVDSKLARRCAPGWLVCPPAHYTAAPATPLLPLLLPLLLSCCC